MSTQSASAADPLSPGTIFQDCDGCPNMVVIPPGFFDMGSYPTEAGHSGDEGPVHRVTFRRAFAIGRFEVTRGEFAAFVAETGHGDGDFCQVDLGRDWEEQPGRSWRNPGYEQGDREPVVCVGWDDAVAYTAWLSEKTGKPYRLPSEAEWEYAARAGTRESRFWGEDLARSCEYANVFDRTGKTELGLSWDPFPCHDGAARTAPVGRYLDNRFELHDMLGNVWEWTADCRNDSYEGAPSDGSAWNRGLCDYRMMRGGAWYYGPIFNRAAERVGVDPDERFYDSGFRVARDLEHP